MLALTSHRQPRKRSATAITEVLQERSHENDAGSSFDIDVTSRLFTRCSYLTTVRWCRGSGRGGRFSAVRVSEVDQRVGW